MGNLYCGEASTTNITMTGGKATSIFGYSLCDTEMTFGSCTVDSISGSSGGSVSISLTDCTVTSAVHLGADYHESVIPETAQLTIDGSTNVGAYVSGRVSGSSTITLKSGQVGAVYGGTASETNLILSGGTVLGDVTGGYSGQTHVTVSGSSVYGSVYGGGRDCSDTNVHITGNGTVYGSVYGAGDCAGVTGQAHVRVDGGTVCGSVYGGGGGGDYGGSTHVSVAGYVGSTAATQDYRRGEVFGGGLYANVTHGTEVLILEGAYVAGDVYGGSGNNAGIASGTNLNMSGGTVTGGLYGGGSSDRCNVTGDTHVTVSGGTVGQLNFGTRSVELCVGIHGGSRWGSNMTGDTYVTVSGGNICGDICGVNNNFDSMLNGSVHISLSGGTLLGRVYGGNHITATTTYPGAILPTSVTGDISITLTDVTLGGTVTSPGGKEFDLLGFVYGGVSRGQTSIVLENSIIDFVECIRQGTGSSIELTDSRVYSRLSLGGNVSVSVQGLVEVGYVDLAAVSGGVISLAGHLDAGSFINVGSLSEDAGLATVVAQPAAGSGLTLTEADAAGFHAACAELALAGNRVVISRFLPEAAGFWVYGNGIPLYISEANRVTYVCSGGYFGSAGAKVVQSWPSNAGSRYTVYGGGKRVTNGDTAIYMKSGCVGYLMGGGNGYTGEFGMVLGDTNVTVSGGTVTGSIFGGGESKPVSGDTHVTISGGTVQGSILGGGSEGGVDYSTYVTVSGGTVYNNVYGGGTVCEVQGSAYISISGGRINGSVFGNGREGPVCSDSTIALSGGTIEGGVYPQQGARVGGSKVISVSGNFAVTDGIDLASATGGRLSITGPLTCANESIRLLGSNTSTGAVIARADSEAYADGSKFQLWCGNVRYLLAKSGTQLVISGGDGKTYVSAITLNFGGGAAACKRQVAFGKGHCTAEKRY